MTVPPDLGVDLSGAQTFCMCGPTQYDITTVTQGTETVLGCVLHGLELTHLSTVLTTLSPSVMSTRAESLIEILCATKVLSSEEPQAWGMLFGVDKALDAVNEACAFEGAVDLFRSSIEGSVKQGFFQHQKELPGESGVKLTIAAAANDGHKIDFNSETCKATYHEILSGHPSCPRKSGQTLGGLAKSKGGMFLLTAGNPSGDANPFEDIQRSRDWK